jgi:pimeloyl-ACP methyl ester carboxylesterase
VEVIDRGSGPPLVLIPGLQGRWEYMRPSVETLSRSFRVLTFSLDEVDAAHLDDYARHVADFLIEKNIERATICGVSFGGLIAVRFASRYPSRCETLVLASTPRPALRLRRRHRIYLKAPWLFGLLFLAETPWRLRPEIRAAIPDARARRRLARQAIGTFFGARISLSRMGSRAKMVADANLEGDCARIAAPTLVVTGEPGLDYVVPVDGSSEYLRLIPNARAVVMPRTGHLGTITRPLEFAAIVRAFVEGHRHAAA